MDGWSGLGANKYPRLGGTGLLALACFILFAWLHGFMATKSKRVSQRKYVAGGGR